MDAIDQQIALHNIDEFRERLVRVSRLIQRGDTAVSAFVETHSNHLIDLNHLALNFLESRLTLPDFSLDQAMDEICSRQTLIDTLIEMARTGKSLIQNAKDSS